jgi:hypothetical protein
VARIRSLKPEFFRSPSMASVSVHARLTFEALWCHADDEGRYRYEPALLKADAWPLDDDVTAKHVEVYVAELIEVAAVCRYESGGKRYLHVVRWVEHQKISHPATSRLPGCPKETHGPDHPQANPQLYPQEDTAVLPNPPEDSRGFRPDLGSGSRNLDLGSGSNTIVAQARPVSVDRLVFEAWQQATGKTRAKLDDKRRRVIARALKAFPLDDVLDAVRGWRNDPWTERPRYNDLALLLRDADHIEKFRDLWRDGPPTPALAPRQQQQRDHLVATHRELQAWAEEVDGHAGNGMGIDRGQVQRELPRPGTAG